MTVKQWRKGQHCPYPRCEGTLINVKRRLVCDVCERLPRNRPRPVISFLDDGDLVEGALGAESGAFVAGPHGMVAK